MNCIYYTYTFLNLNKNILFNNKTYLFRLPDAANISVAATLPAKSFVNPNYFKNTFRVRAIYENPSEQTDYWNGNNYIS